MEDGKPVVRAKRSQFGDMDDGIMSIGKWEERWAKGQTRFHMTCVHPQLQKHIHLLTEGKNSQRFFLPLCGKSVDLKWLAQQGHDVIGNECVELACEQFYEENNTQYTTEPLTLIKGKIFKSKDPNLRVTLYCCDFFDLTKDVIGEFDCVWDRGSLAAINTTDRRPYAEQMASLLSSHTRYLADVFKLDNTNFSGPPHNFPSEEMVSYFGNSCNVKQVDEVDAFTDWQREWGIDSFYACDYFITLK